MLYVLPNESWHSSPPAAAEAVAVLDAAPQLGTGLSSGIVVVTLLKNVGSEVAVVCSPGEEETSDAVEIEDPPDDSLEATADEVEFCDMLTEVEIDELGISEEGVDTNVSIDVTKLGWEVLLAEVEGLGMLGGETLEDAAVELPGGVGGPELDMDALDGVLDQLLDMEA